MPIRAALGEKVLLNMHKVCRFISWACAKYHPGICSQSNLLVDSEGPDQTLQMPLQTEYIQKKPNDLDLHCLSLSNP